MRRRVARLPEAVANQIAAGEVVERPASVVKELAENALDAEATKIEVEIEGGGLTLIRVTDDGHGMSREDAVLALERHATSKIREASDLHSIGTLGFRGEALPSIASVSRFTLVTRVREEAEATRIVVEGGILKEVSAAGAAPGTSIEVRDLFYNVPARRKFLKTEQTEVSHVSEAISRLALARPHAGFKLTNNGRVVLDAAKTSDGDPRGRLGRILGRAVAERLFPVSPADREHTIEIGGFLSAPDLSERTARSLHVFVNGRYVRDRTIHHAIQDGYRTMLERGRYPVVLLSIAIDPALVDVNVHPQKIEVRFQDSGSVHRAVSGALSRTLAAEPWLLPAQRSILPTPSLPPMPEARRYALSPIGTRPSFAMETEPRHYEPSSQPPQLEAELAGRFGSLEPVGQVMGTYLVCQAPGRMVVIDQHAAHERIAFERMKRECANKAVQEQPLLVPLSLELDAVRASIAHDAIERLRLLGLELEPFGGNTFLVKSRPAAIGSANLESLVIDLLDELKEVGETTPMKDKLESLLSCAACHTVVRAGDRLSNPEIKALLLSMDEIDFGAHCPHGRPVFVEWSEQKLAAMFHRS